jgi:hypothetical protein
MAKFSQSLLSLGSPDCPVVHRTVSGGATDSVRCARLALANRPLSGLRRRCTAKIHRSVRWCTGLSGEPFTGELVALGRWSTVCTGQCPVRQRLSDNNGRLRQIRKEICTGQCLVRQSTEGKIYLPGMFSTAPSCLGAIKGTPRRMQEHTKHSYNIPKHQDLDSAHLFLCDSI